MTEDIVEGVEENTGAIRQSILEDTRPSQRVAAEKEESQPLSEESFEDSLQRCIVDGDSKRFKRLAKERKADLFRIRNAEGETLVHTAIKNSQNGILDYVMDAVYNAVTTGKLEGVSEPDYVSWLDQKVGKNRLSALHLAAFYGNLYAARKLLSRGARLETTSRSGLSPLHLAAQGNQPLPIVFFACEKHLDVHVRDKEGNTPLHWACKFGAAASVSYLVKWYDATAINAGNNKGVTPLHMAVEAAVNSGDTSVIKILLFAGASRNVRDRAGRGPMDYLYCVQEEKKGPDAVWVDIARVLREPRECACLMLKRPIKQIQPSRLLLWVYTLCQLLNVGITAFFTLPRIDSRAQIFSRPSGCGDAKDLHHSSGWIEHRPVLGLHSDASTGHKQGPRRVRKVQQLHTAGTAGTCADRLGVSPVRSCHEQPDQALHNMREMHRALRPPLSLDQQLRGNKEPQRLPRTHPFPLSVLLPRTEHIHRGTLQRDQVSA